MEPPQSQNHHLLSRRRVLAGGITLAVGGATSLLRSPAALAQVESGPGTNTLIAYFTRSGNTRVVARQLQRDLKADLFEILPETPYPEDYLENVAQASREREAGFKPPLKSLVQQWSRYERVFLGFPVWGGTAPPIIVSFLTEHDTAGKVLIPFITHGKYGLGDSLSVLSRHAPKADILPAYSEECDQERDTMESVDLWLAKM